MNWTEFSNEKLMGLLENLVAEGSLAQKLGIDVTPTQIVGASRDILMDVIRTSLPLAHLMDSSDLVLHAEGPAVRDAAPRLSAVNWLTGTAERVIRRLSGSLFDLANRDAQRLMRALDLRLTGFAPGSLYAGFAVEAPDEGLLRPGDDPVIRGVREALRQLPEVPPMIGDDAVYPEVRQLIPDPARRDATLTALYQLAPTGRRGIHTLDLTSPGIPSSELSQRERVVLREAIDRPQLMDRKSGAFTGELREIDLDARRFHLRNVPGIGGLRCIVGDMAPSEAKRVIGEFVRVSGDYETDREGRPRLMVVNALQVLPRAEQESAELLV